VLAQHFLRVYAAKNNRQLDGFSDEALGCLEAYSWPGNVRASWRTWSSARWCWPGACGSDAADLPDAVRERSGHAAAGRPRRAGGCHDGRPTGCSRSGSARRSPRSRRGFSRRRSASDHGNKTLTAKMLGIDPKTVFRKLKQGEADDPASGDAPASR